MKKEEKLKKILKELRSVVVAYSGGLDSTFLVKSAIDALGSGSVIAVTARSETYPLSEYREAVELAKRLGARHRTIKTSELSIERFRRNPVDRCYHCKKELFVRLDAIRGRSGFGCVLDGTNRDDLDDVRYGRIAAKEVGVRSPLLEAGMGKEEIRAASKRLGLPTWSKPSFACLASRIPFHTKITAATLRRVESSEAFIRSLGLTQVRVRVHRDTARIEVDESQMGLVIRHRRAIAQRLRSMGFVYVSLDLAGYRTGSMHEAPGAKHKY
jgi:uncharacterized protein